MKETWSYDDTGTTSSQKIFQWVGPEEGIAAKDWKWPQNYRADDIWTSPPLHMIHWYSHEQYTALEKTTGKSFRVIYPPEDKTIFRHQLNWVLVGPNAWKEWLNPKGTIASYTGWIGKKKYHCYQSRHKWGPLSSITTLHVDPNTALLLQLTEEEYEDSGRMYRSRLIDYTWNEKIEAAVFDPRAEGVVKPVIIDLSKPAPMRSIQPGRGVGEIELGMTEKEVIALLGEPDWKEPSSELWLYYFNEGLEIKLDDKHLVGEIVCHDVGGFGLVAAFRRFPGKTPEGIGIGSTLQDVKKAYGRPDSAFSGAWSRYLYTKLKLDFVINTDRNRVVKVHLVGK